MEASWHPNGIKNVHNFERRFFEKSCSRCSGGTIFKILGIKIESKKRSKIDPKIACNMKCILASIFGGFWSILGPKLGWKIDQKSKQKGIEKTMEKSRRLGRVLGASWGVPRSANQCGAGAARAPTASRCPQEPPVSKNTSIQDTSTSTG